MAQDDVGLRGISPAQRQVNFESRIREYESLLHSLVNTFKLQLPEEDVNGTYEPADEYAFYRDLSSLFAAATNDILIVDAYFDERVFNLYVSKVPDATAIRILSNKIGPNVETVARMYAKSQPLELRSSGSIHDRLVFLDQRGWGMCPEVRGKRTAPSTPSSGYQIRRQPPRVREPRSDLGSRRCAVVESGQRR